MAKAKNNDAPAVELGGHELVAIENLVLSPHNVRKSHIKDDLSELKASIAANGLLQPLIGHTFNPNDHVQAEQLRGVCGGQRRMLALKELCKEGRLQGTDEVLVRIVPEDLAIEVSLAENIERKNMTPADEFRAFQQLLDTGRYNSQLIADRFGYNKRYVEARLRLAQLHPEVLAAMEKGEFGLEAAKAYATCTDQERQLKLYKQQARSHYDKHGVTMILAAVNAQGTTVRSAVGTFIGGKKAYEKAGGQFDTSPFDDLFKGTYLGKRDETMIDGGIVKQLWDAAVAKARPKLKKEAEQMFGIPIDDVLFADKPGTNDPKCPKGWLVLETGYSWNGGLSDGDFKNRLAALGKAKVPVRAAAIVEGNGKPSIRQFKVYVDPAAKPIFAKFKAMTEEQQAKATLQREKEDEKRQDRMLAARLFWYTLTPDEKIARCTFNRGGWSRDECVQFELSTSISNEELEPFIKQAQQQRKDEAEAKAKAEAEAAAAEQAAKDEWTAKTAAATAALAALREDPNPPEVLVLDYDEGTVTVTKTSDGWFFEHLEDGENIPDLDVVIDLLDDYIGATGRGQLTTFATTADYEASVTQDAINDVADQEKESAELEPAD